MRDSFVFYRSFYEALKEMDKNVQADCLMALAQYALDGDMPDGLNKVGNELYRRR